MKTKTLKIVATILMALMVICSVSQVVLASASDVVDSVEGKIDTDVVASDKISEMAGKVLGLIQIASAVAAVILIAVFGFKFIMGSANEKADYQKSFIPLIVGVVVVFAATSIAKLLFSTFAS